MLYSEQQAMLSLSFLSYLGFYDTTAGVQVSRRTYEEIRDALEKSAPIAGQWEIVWGPAMYRLPLTVFDENLMYVVRSTKQRSRYAIIVRGTDPLSLTNWVLGDFSVAQQTPWPYQVGAHGLAPKTSKGTARGLQALQHMVPHGVPGDGKTLYAFLVDEVARNPRERLTVAVTGHSLGGALSPALALWLADTQQASDHPDHPPWDPARRCTIEVYSFAGPTPGNADFAAYYDARLGATTHRIWNRFDVVPHGWVKELLGSLPRLYSPDIAPSILMSIVLRTMNLLGRNGHYWHIAAGAQPIQGGRLTPYLRDYAAQMIYQHTAAYPELLGLMKEIDASLHFHFDEGIRDAVESARRELAMLAGGAKQAGHAAATAGQTSATPSAAGAGTAALTAPKRDLRKRARLVTRRLHRIYRVPATLALTMVPERLALSKLRRRGDCFHSRLTRSAQA